LLEKSHINRKKTKERKYSSWIPDEEMEKQQPEGETKYNAPTYKDVDDSLKNQM